jgi:hypothetical protein
MNCLQWLSEGIKQEDPMRRLTAGLLTIIAANTMAPTSLAEDQKRTGLEFHGASPAPQPIPYPITNLKHAQSDQVAIAKKRKSKVTLGDVPVTKELDKASPRIAKAKRKPKAQKYMTYELKDAMISGRTAPHLPQKGPRPGLLEDGPTGLQKQGPSGTGTGIGGTSAPTSPAGRLY